MLSKIPEKAFEIAGTSIGMVACLSIAAQVHHNFVAVNDIPFGPGYPLEISEPLDLSGIDPALRGQGRELLWQAAPADKYFRDQTLPDGTEVFSWVLRHAPSGCSIRETVRGRCSRFHIYGTPELVSPEVFVDIDLAPDETQMWQRSYAFEMDREASE